MRKILYGFLILIIVSFISLPFINWQSLKQPILNKVQSLTGCVIDINGPIHIHLLPSPKIVLNRASVRANGDSLKNDSFQLISAKVKKLRLTWFWTPLLRGKLDINHFDLKQPEIVLKSLPSFKKTVDQASPPSHGTSKASHFSLHHFSISDGKIIVDAHTPQQMDIHNISVGGFIESLKGPAELGGSLTYNGMNCNFKINVMQPAQTIPVKGFMTLNYKGQIFNPLSFEGFLDTQDKTLFKTHLTLHHENNTVQVKTVTTLANSQTDVTVFSKKLTYQTYQLLNVNAALSIQDGEVFLNKMDANAYEGKLDLKGHLQANKKFTVKGHLHQLDLTKVPSLKDLPLKKGRLETFAHLQGDLEDTNAWVETLSGTMNINVTEGAVETIDIEALTQQIKKIKDSQSLAEGVEITQKRNALDIKTMKVDFSIDKGIAKTKNLEVFADPVDITGQGTIDIRQTLLNLMLKVHVKALGNLTIPFKVTGPWAKPEYGVDQEQFGVLITKSFAQHTVDSVMAQVRKKAQEALNQKSINQDTVKNFKPEKIAKQVLGGLLG